MFASIDWLYDSYFRTAPAVGAEGGRFPGTDKGALSKMTVMSCASPSARTKQSRSFPLGLLSRAQSHREKTKNKWVSFWKRPNCVWAAIKPLKVECQTVQQSRPFYCTVSGRVFEVWVHLRPLNASQQRAGGTKVRLAF